MFHVEHARVIGGSNHVIAPTDAFAHLPLLPKPIGTNCASGHPGADRFAVRRTYTQSIVHGRATVDCRMRTAKWWPSVGCTTQRETRASLGARPLEPNTASRPASAIRALLGLH